MTWQPSRVVVVGRREGNAVKLIGSGAVVADQRVLTARHVVVDKGTGTPRPGLVVRRDGSERWLDASVAWPGTPACDAAVLAVPDALAEQAHPLGLFALGGITNRTGWYARGYPMVGDVNPSEKLTSLKGATHEYFAGEEELRLGVEEPPANCKGLSGAAVIVGERIVGVVRAVERPEDWDRRLLLATPVARFWRDAAVLSALGVCPGHDLYAERVKQVCARIERELRGPAAPCRRIGECVKASDPDDPAGVAKHLVTNVRARDAAVALGQLDEEVADEGTREGAAVVRRLFWWALRNAVDWAPYHVSHGAIFSDRSELRDAPVSLELPFLSMTVAELVLAGLDDRPVRFAEPSAAQELPRGATMQRLPATAVAPLFQFGAARTAEAVVRHFANEEGDVDFRNRPMAMTDEEYAEMRTHVERRLYALTYEARRSDRRPHYLVLTERDLGAPDTRGTHWAAIQARLVRELPSLRMVLLCTGGYPDAESIATQVASMFRVSPPAP